MDHGVYEIAIGNTLGSLFREFQFLQILFLDVSCILREIRITLEIILLQHEGRKLMIIEI